jgi:hypothetical protein
MADKMTTTAHPVDRCERRRSYMAGWRTAILTRAPRIERSVVDADYARGLVDGIKAIEQADKVALQTTR